MEFFIVELSLFENVTGLVVHKLCALSFKSFQFNLIVKLCQLGVSSQLQLTEAAYRPTVVSYVTYHQSTPCLLTS